MKPGELWRQVETNARVSRERPREPDIDSLQRLFVAAEPPDVGNWLTSMRAGVPYAFGTSVPLVAPAYAPNAAGVNVPKRLSRSPQPGDVLRTYVTGRELGLGIPLSAVVEELSHADLLTVLHVAAELVDSLRARPFDEARDNQVAALLRQPLRGRAEEAIRQGRALLSAQAAMLLVKLALRHCPRTPATQPQKTAWLLGAVLVIQDALEGDYSDRTAQPPVLGIVGDARAVATLIQTQAFAEQPELVTMLAHSYLRWRELPRRHRSSSKFVDLEAEFESATGVTIDDFVTVGLAIWARRTQQRSAVLADDSLGLPLPKARVRRAASLLTSSPTNLAALIRTDEQRFGWAWSFDPIRRFPVVRVRGGRLVVLSSSLVLARIFSLVRWDVEGRLREQGEEGRASRARRFWDFMCETDARETIEAFAPGSGIAKRTYSASELETAYARRGSAPKLADFAIDYPAAWLVGDVTSSALSREVVIGGSLRHLQRDLVRIVDRKAEQIESTIDQLLADERPLTGVPSRPRRKFVPILIAAEGFPVSAATMEHVWSRLRARNSLQGPKIAPLRILDIEDLTILEALAAQGVSALDVLEKHESAAFRAMSLRNFVTIEASFRLETPPRLWKPFEGSWEPIFRAVSESQAAAPSK